MGRSGPSKTTPKHFLIFWAALLFGLGKGLTLGANNVTCYGHLGLSVSVLVAKTCQILSITPLLTFPY